MMSQPEKPMHPLIFLEIGLFPNAPYIDRQRLVNCEAQVWLNSRCFLDLEVISFTSSYPSMNMLIVKKHEYNRARRMILDRKPRQAYSNYQLEILEAEFKV